MPNGLSPHQVEMFKRLDERPERRGFSVGLIVKRVGEFRSRRKSHPLPSWRFTSEQRRHRLAIDAHLLEKDERQ